MRHRPVVFPEQDGEYLFLLMRVNGRHYIRFGDREKCGHHVDVLHEACVEFGLGRYEMKQMIRGNGATALRGGGMAFVYHELAFVENPPFVNTFGKSQSFGLYNRRIVRRLLEGEGCTYFVD